jgi:hypothetical protein
MNYEQYFEDALRRLRDGSAIRFADLERLAGHCARSGTRRTARARCCVVLNDYPEWHPREGDQGDGGNRDPHG